MNEPLILLVVNSSELCCDRDKFVDDLNKTVSLKFNSRKEDNPLKAVFSITLQTWVVWISDANSADYLVSLKSFLLRPDGAHSVLFDYPYEEFTNCVEISSKNRTSNDIEHINNLFDHFMKRYQTNGKIFKSSFRIVCQFDSVDSAKEAGEEIFEQLQQDEQDEEEMKTKSCTVRQLAVKDLALLKCYFRGTKKPFSHVERDWSQRHPDQTIGDWAALESAGANHAIGNTGREQDLHIVCATNYDLRLLVNYSRGTVALSDQERITFRSSATSPSSASSAPLKPCSSSTNPSSLSGAAALPDTQITPAPASRSKAWTSSAGALDEEQPATFTTSSAGQALLSAITSRRSKPLVYNRQTYVFWDVGTCQVSDTDLYAPVSLADSLAGNISAVLKHCASRPLLGNSCAPSDTVMSCTSRLLFMPSSFQQGAALCVSSLLEACLKALTSQQQYRAVSYSKKRGVEVRIREEIDSLLQELRRADGHATDSSGLALDDSQQPLLCFVLAHHQFASLVACLTLEQLRHIVLIHQDEQPEEALSALGVQQYSWAAVRRLHTLSREQRLRLLEDSTPRFAVAKQTLLPLSTEPNLPSSVSEARIDLKHTSLAVYFKKLIDWRFLRSDGLSEEESQGVWTSPLFGETGEAAQSGHTPPEERTAVRVDANPRGKKFFLVVTGLSNAAVQKRLGRFGKMVADCLRNRQIHELPGWQSQHRLAMTDSQAMVRQQEISRACVLFHYSGDTSLAEVVALQTHQHTNMHRYLSKLKPRSVVWQVPERCVTRLSDADWERLRVAHSTLMKVRTDSEEEDSASPGQTCPGSGRHSKATEAVLARHPAAKDEPLVSLSAWGFTSLLEGGLEEVLTEQEADQKQAEDNTHFIGKDSSLGDSTAHVNAHLSTQNYVSLAAGESEDSLQLLPLLASSYLFKDREAGIFFVAFKSQFCAYLAQAFAVQVEETSDRPETSSRRSRRPDDLNDMSRQVLKITFHGASQSSLASARSYLEQLNPANLTRLQVFFPQVHAAKFKELCNKKTTQQSVLSAMRTTGNHSAAAIVDPMQCQGFVNIRMKPPIHSHGVRRMPLPADCTITICGSNQVAEHAAVLREIEASFCAVGSEYAVGCVNVSFAHPLKKQLTVKAQREEFVQQHGLVAVKWEEGSRLTGSVGVARLWAPTQALLRQALRTIEGEAETHGVLSEGDAPLLGEEQKDVEDPKFVASIEEDVRVANSPLTGYSASCDGSWASDRDGQLLEPLSTQQAMSGPPPGLQRLSLRHPSLVGDGSEDGALSEGETRLVQLAVYWPDQSMRHVLLADPLRRILADMLRGFQDQGVNARYPYGNSSHSSVGVLLQGAGLAVEGLAKTLNGFLGAVCRKLCCVKLILSPSQFSLMEAAGFAKLDVIQAKVGVHIGRDMHDMRAIEHEVRSAFDLRLAPTASPGSMDVPLLTVRISGGALSCHSLDVAVISSRTSSAGWTWGVGCLLVVVDASSLAGLQQPEALRLASGEVLVHSDAFTGKTILRIKPREQTQMHGAQQQAKELMTVIAKGLGRAEELGLSGVAVSAPVDCDSFRALDADQVRSLTVEAVVEFCKSAMGLRCLRRVACIDVSAAQSGEGNKTDSSLLAPAGGDPMARTMLSLLEQQRRRQQAVPRLSAPPFARTGLFGFSAQSSRCGLFADALHLELVEASVPLSLSFVTSESADSFGSSEGEGENEEDRFYEALFRVDDPLSLNGLLGGSPCPKVAAPFHFLTVKGLPRNVLLAVESVASVVNTIHRPKASNSVHLYR